MRELNIGHTFSNGTKVLEVIDTDNEYRLTTKFIGYTTKGEFIIATLGEGDSYMWTTYSNSLAGVIRAYEWKNRVDSIDAHIESVDSALVEAIDSIENQDLTVEQEDILEAMNNLRGVINV